MSNFIVEEERGTYTGRRHPNNGYYAFTGPMTQATGRRHLPSPCGPTLSGHYERDTPAPKPSGRV